ncbi:DUF4249 domain-containing protein [Algoriphagus sp.]|uniref:DUF4249 domain-containing protein n=1 Tax=Algoriphagus sp. TaxID=1872435 RepID=UPI00391C2D1B
MRKLSVFSLLIVFFGFNSCVEQIEFELEKAERERLIVSGTLTDLNETQVVFLSETTSKARQPLLADEERRIFTLNDLPRPLAGAQVTLVAVGGGIWFYRETKPGRYELNGFNGRVVNSDLYLQISAGNRVYRSKAQRIPEAIGSDDLSFSFERTRLKDNPDAAQVIIKTEVTLPEQIGDYYLRWTVDEAYFWDLTFFPNAFNMPPPPCIVFDFPDPERIPLINGDLLNRPGGKSTQIVTKRLVDQSFLSRHYFNVRQLSISKDAFEYWRRVRELVNNTGSVFDSPPAQIRGNIFNVDDSEEVVLGYFEVAKARVSRIYTTFADVPFFVEKTCEYDPNRRRDQYPPTCLSCNLFPNSQQEYPEWWFDE